MPGRRASLLTWTLTLKLMISVSLPRSLVPRWVANSDFLADIGDGPLDAGNAVAGLHGQELAEVEIFELRFPGS